MQSQGPKKKERMEKKNIYRSDQDMARIKKKKKKPGTDKIGFADTVFHRGISTLSLMGRRLRGPFMCFV